MHDISWSIMFMDDEAGDLGSRVELANGRTQRGVRYDALLDWLVSVTSSRNGLAASTQEGLHMSGCTRNDGVSFHGSNCALHMQ